ncbi:hypothetical protein BSPWISOXPB_11283, partial [uncultured Gammaproteobacteria bacterium]
QSDWRQLIGFAGLGVDALERQCQFYPCVEAIGA